MKTKDVLYRNLLTGTLFVLWGMLWLALSYENTFGKALSGFFIVFGIFISVKSYRQWKNEIIFTALMGPVFAVASVIYALSYYRYEKGANEN